MAPQPLEVDDVPDRVAACQSPSEGLATTCSATSSSAAADAGEAGWTGAGPGESDLSLPLPWRKGKMLGAGSYGIVYRALSTKGDIFAVKESVVRDGNEDDRKFVKKLEDELNVYKFLRHPNIVTYLGHDYENGKLFIYLEYIAGGSMASVLVEFGPLNGQMLHRATSGLLEGLNYLHTCDPPVVHRDIKSANVLVGVDFCVKLADFGCSKRSDVTRSFTTTGSVLWMAPEVIRCAEGFGRKADLWSLGCTIIEMATAVKPWGDCAFDNFVAAVMHIGMSNDIPPIADTLPETVQDLIGQCLRRNPEERPWARTLLGHAYVVNGAAHSGLVACATG